MIYHEPRFVDDTFCDSVIQYYHDNQHKSYHYDGNNTYPLSIKKDMYKDVLDRIQLVGETVFNVQVKLDLVQVVRWPIGSAMDWHKDHDTDVLASMIYLNDSFSGGLTHIDECVNVVPKKGNMTIFRSHDLPHRVSQVINGERYTLAAWWTNYE